MIMTASTGWGSDLEYQKELHGWHLSMMINSRFGHPSGPRIWFIYNGCSEFVGAYSECLLAHSSTCSTRAHNPIGVSSFEPIGTPVPADKLRAAAAAMLYPIFPKGGCMERTSLKYELFNRERGNNPDMSNNLRIPSGPFHLPGGRAVVLKNRMWSQYC